jgi:DNA-binding beta-propeller fold protein YncE
MATHFFGIRDRIYSYRNCIGRVAVNGEGFLCPVDLALASNEVAYVVNRSFEYRPDGLRVTKCTLTGDYLGEFGSGGEGEGQFVWPVAVAVDRDENVYVADEWLNRILIYDKDGKILRSWGKRGSGDGELTGPAGLAFTRDNDLFVVDSRNNRVQKFTADGRYIGQFGSAGKGPGQFNLPWGIGLDKDGNVYVADWRNDRIQKFTAEGKWLASCGSSGSGAGQFNRPSGVCVDNDGDIYVADRQNDRVQVLTPEGRFITAITGNAGLSKMGAKQLQANSDMIRQRALALVNDGGSWERALSYPTAVKADAQNRIAILDMGRYRIQLYEKSRNATLN